MFTAQKTFQKRSNLLWPILIVALGMLISGVFIRLYLLQTAKQFADDFYSQNSLILGRGDSYELAYKLNYLSSSVHWVCIKASKGEKVIYESNKSSDCGEGIFQTKQLVSSPNNQSMQIEFTIAIPSMLKIILVIFVLTQSLLIGLFYFIRMKSKQDKMKADLAWQSKINQVAKQVAHDIRSPLSALKLATSFLPDEVVDQKKLLVSVSNRIESIISDLVLKESTSPISEATSQNGYSFILPVVQSIVSEKEVVCAREFPDVEISFTVTQSMDDVGCLISDQELMRVLSNIINNALEAFDSKSQKKKIHILMEQDIDSIVIKVNDNGKGMTSSQIEQVLSVGGSFGKANGKGLGIKHARETIQFAKGELKFSSKVGMGTEVSIILPSVDRPQWLCRSIDLRGKKTIVVLDDDVSVIEAWKTKFRDINKIIQITYFSNPVHFKFDAININETLFIVDHDFNDSSIKGLDFIKNHSLIHSAILCTSYFNDPEVQKGLLSLGSKLLPKHLMATVNIIVDPTIKSEQLNSGFKIVLIDDDDLVHYAWGIGAQNTNVTLDCFYSYDEFKRKSYPINTPLFIDKNLKKECGLKISEKLVEEMGFSRIYLATGERISRHEVPKSIIGIVPDKVFPTTLIEQLREGYHSTFH